jgi:hypothetical protein
MDNKNSCFYLWMLSKKKERKKERKEKASLGGHELNFQK